MPSGKLYWARVKSDPAFAADVRAAWAKARQAGKKGGDYIIDRNGRGRIVAAYAEDAWTEVVRKIGAGASFSHIGRLDGMPTTNAIYMRRQRDDAFRALVNSALGSRPRVAADAARVYRGLGEGPLGSVLFRRLSQNEVFAAVTDALPGFLPRAIQDDIRSEMILAVLEGRVEIGDLKQAARRFVSDYHRRAGTWRARSLDAPLGEGGFSLYSVIAA
jgi:hypothetical protein